MATIFGVPFLVCCAMISILSYVGIHVLKREIIFIDIALAQTVAVGAIVARIAFHAHDGSAASLACSLGAVVVAALFYAAVRQDVFQIPIEAVIGISYAIAAAAALFLLGIGPGGHVHVQHMLAGSILWATWTDLAVCLAVFAAAGVGFFRFRVPFRAASEGYGQSDGARAGAFRWDFLFYLLVGFVVAIAVRIAGVVLVFAFLIIPATISALFAAGWSARVAIAWLSGVTASIVGLVFSDRLDFSVGPSIALFLGVALGLAAVLRLGYRRTAACLTACVLAGTVLLWAQPVSTVYRPQETQTPDTPAPEADDRLFPQAQDPATQSDTVCRTLTTDVKRGADLAIEFLKRDPPLFFRQVVIDALEKAVGEPLGFDVMQPFMAPQNQEALHALREKLAERDTGER
jgi:zinc/manganese transport system permease protein